MIEVKNLSKKFKKEYLFQDFNLTIAKNQVTAIIGPSGCGKTTLLRMIAGLEPYEKGSISGIDQERISYVFQEDRLLPWLSVYKNIELVLKSKFDSDEIDHRIREVLALLDLSDAEAMMPDELSGGMQRRVAIGRALAYDGDVMLLDEPFKGMDDKLKNDVLAELDVIWNNKRKTIILITHDLADARKLADKIYEFSGRPLRQVGVIG